MENRLSRSIWAWSAFILLAVAAGLRLFGLTWGLPDSVHHYSYHPDEFLLVGSAFSVFSNADLNPHFYNYPSLYIYLCAAGQALASVLGLASQFGLYLVCRIITAVMGTLAAACCLWGCKRLYGGIAGLAAGALLAFSAVHAQHSHFATVDVPSTLFVSCCLIASIAAYRSGKRSWLMVAAVAAGLAAGTKYNAGLVGLTAVLVPLIGADIRSVTKRIGYSLATALVMLAVFLLTTPGAVLHTQEFVQGIRYELLHSSTGHGLVFAGTGPGIVYAIKNLSWGISPALWAVSFLLIIPAIKSRRKESLLILAFLVPYFVLMSVSQVRFVRYLIPVLPALAVFAALGIASVREMCSERVYRALTAAFTLCLVAGLIYSVAVVALFAPPDPRNLCYQYIKSKVSPGLSIGVIDLPWFYSPPLGPNIGYGTVQTRQRALEESDYRITLLTDLSGVLPTWAVVSSYEIDDALRLRGVTGLSGEESTLRDSLLQKYAIITENYSEVRTFKRNLLWTSSDSLPHDMNYCAPRITLYRLKI